MIFNHDGENKASFYLLKYLSDIFEVNMKAGRVRNGPAFSFLQVNVYCYEPNTG
jgi:hypothetical protein